MSNIFIIYCKIMWTLKYNCTAHHIYYKLYTIIFIVVFLVVIYFNCCLLNLLWVCYYYYYYYQFARLYILINNNSILYLNYFSLQIKSKNNSFYRYKYLSAFVIVFEKFYFTVTDHNTHLKYVSVVYYYTL